MRGTPDTPGSTIDRYMGETEFVAELTEADRLRLLEEAKEVLALGGKYLRFTDSQGLTMLLQIEEVDPKTDGH